MHSNFKIKVQRLLLRGGRGLQGKLQQNIIYLFILPQIQKLWQKGSSCKSNKPLTTGRLKNCKVLPRLLFERERVSFKKMFAFPSPSQVLRIAKKWLCPFSYCRPNGLKCMNSRITKYGIYIQVQGGSKELACYEKKFTAASKTFYKIPQNTVPKAFQHLVKKFGSQF